MEGDVGGRLIGNVGEGWGAEVVAGVVGLKGCVVHVADGF